MSLNSAQLQAYLRSVNNLSPALGSLGDAFLHGTGMPPLAGQPPLRWVGSIADLRALQAPADNEPVVLIGYNTIGDKPHVLYIYDPTSALADDGGAVIQPTAVTGDGRWILA